MRLFVGVEVDDEVRAQAERVVAALRRRLDARVGARWVSLENLHLTVRFVGHVPDDRAGPVLAALDTPLATHAFEIELDGCGRFPPRGAPRVLWIALARGVPALAELHQQFNDRLLRFGYAPEDRPFSAHLTLARIKEPRGADARLVDEALAHVVTGTVVQKIEHVTVFESRLSPKGPRYSPLRRIDLLTA